MQQGGTKGDYYTIRSWVGARKGTNRSWVRERKGDYCTIRSRVVARTEA